MSIQMQGSWTVYVKSKEAAFAQRFVIAGAGAGNGTYSGETSTPAVHVAGDNWTVNIQHDRGDGTGWRDSTAQLKFPSVVGSEYRFDIESNDSGGDGDFNDLILGCRTPFTGIDFLIYGTVSSYDDACIFNPCTPKYAIIESQPAVAHAARNPALKHALEDLYPSRIPFPHPPLPDPPPIRPLVIPLDEEATLPAKKAQIYRRSQVATPRLTRETPETMSTAVSFEKTVVVGKQTPIAAASRYGKASLSALHATLTRACRPTALPGYALRFQEYDRTGAELGGAPYSGDGVRNNLGSTITDHNGNYIFRFTGTWDELIEELSDIAPGDGVATLLPDVIVQLLDPAAASGVVYESAPYWNTPPIKRINVCVPASSASAFVCDKQLIIQKVGNIYVGPLLGGTRSGPSTFLDATGRITNANPYYGPGVQCAAWCGSLYLYACLSNPEIRYYTIRYKKHSDTGWQFAKDSYTYYKYDSSVLPAGNPFLPVLVGHHPIQLAIDGGALVESPAYHNIEVDSGAGWLPADMAALPWLASDLVRKIVLSSAAYEADAGGPGAIDFRIEGYRANGTRFPGADDVITLYVDNVAPDVYINKTVKMIDPAHPADEQSYDDCALFTLPPKDDYATTHDVWDAAPLRIRFRANERFGFAQAYELYMNKGSMGKFAVKSDTVPPYITRTYAHAGDNHCDAAAGRSGTLDDPTFDVISNYVTAEVEPAAGGWLTASQLFCAFDINLYCSVRKTDGYSVPGPYWAPFPIVVGIKRP